jgi:hypothetical protein
MGPLHDTCSLEETRPMGPSGSLQVIRELSSEFSLEKLFHWGRRPLPTYIERRARGGDLVFLPFYLICARSPLDLQARSRMLSGIVIILLSIVSAKPSMFSPLDTALRYEC